MTRINIQIAKSDLCTISEEICSRRKCHNNYGLRNWFKIFVNRKYLWLDKSTIRQNLRGKMKILQVWYDNSEDSICMRAPQIECLNVIINNLPEYKEYQYGHKRFSRKVVVILSAKYYHYENKSSYQIKCNHIHLNQSLLISNTHLYAFEISENLFCICFLFFFIIDYLERWRSHRLLVRK